MLSSLINISELGYENDLHFWQTFSTISDGSSTDHMVSALNALGYSGHPGDMFAAWLRDKSAIEGSLYDMANSIKASLEGATSIAASILPQLQALGTLTFFKDYRPEGASLDADFSVGSPTATYTAARSASAPATYVDSNGVVQLLTTANARRRNEGYYDATGFHALNEGELVETAGTNLVTKSNNVEDAIFTKTNVTADNDDAGSSSPDGTATAPSLTATDTDGTFLLASGVTARTYSVFIKRKTGTGTISITADSGATYSAVTVTADWARFQVTAVSASQTCGIKIGTSGDAIYVWTNQFETSPYMTSPVPTTTAALTRPAEVLKYETAGNRTAATETIIIKFAPGSTFANDGVRRWLNVTETKQRIVFKFTTQAYTKVSPNATDNSGLTADNTTIPQANTSYVFAGTMASTGNPNVRSYLDGVQEGSDNNTDWTENAWGTYFFLGGNVSGVDQLNGTIEAIAIYSNVLDATAIAAAGALLNQ